MTRGRCEDPRHEGERGLAAVYELRLEFRERGGRQRRVRTRIVGLVCGACMDRYAPPRYSDQAPQLPGILEGAAS